MPDTLIPVNSLPRHIDPLRDRLAAVATDVISSGYYVLGAGVRDFEEAFAAYCGSAHAVGVANGTDALELSLRALGVGIGDRVAVCANAAMYGTTAVMACGAEPVFIDIEPVLATMDPSALARALAGKQRIAAVIVTHLYGRLARIEEIVRLCREHGANVIEDCAQSHGATGADGRRAGAFGDLSSFSFYPTKNLGALGDGGAVVSSSEELAARVRQLRQYGWSDKYTNALAGGRNSRLDEIQARMLSVMLPFLDTWNRRRREIANRYSAEITNAVIETPPPAGAEYVGHLYVVRTDRRDDLRKHLGEQGIQTDIHYPIPDHRQPVHQGRFDAVSLPVTERDAMRVITLPCFPELTDDEVDRVVQACNQF